MSQLTISVARGRIRSLLSLAFALLLVLTPTLPTSAAANNAPPSATVTNQQLAAGQPAPFNKTDLVNPMRGQYLWGGTTKWGSNTGTVFPSSANQGYQTGQYWPGTDVSYFRFTWAEVQPTQTDFSFARIEQELAAAAARGQKMGFRVMAADSCCSPLSSARAIMPDWLTTQGVNQWIYNANGEIATVPDWNNSRYLSAMTTLISKLGEKFDGDDRVAFVDMLGYGNFGEWHSYPMNSEYPRINGGQTEISEPNVKLLVDANLRAFSKTRLLSLTPNTYALELALARTDVGIRIDCLGAAGAGGAWVRMMSVPASLTRWKTAPIVSEWCNSNYTTAEEVPSGSQYQFIRNDIGKDLYQVGRAQVARWHVSLLSSGNFPYASDGGVMDSQQWDDFAMANKTSGYRYTLSTPGLAANVARGSSLPVTISWTNLAVAASYDPWQIWLELRPHGASYAASWVQSGFDLRTLVAPDAGIGNAPLSANSSYTDQLAVPPGLATGQYDVVVQVKGAGMAPAVSKMPVGYYQNLRMKLDSALTQTSDGGYILGTVGVS